MLLDPFGVYIKTSHGMEKEGTTQDSQVDARDQSSKPISLQRESSTALSQNPTIMKVYDDIAQLEGYTTAAEGASSKRQRTIGSYSELHSGLHSPSSYEDDMGLDSSKPKRSRGQKKGSVISPEDREPPNEEELAFFEEQARLLQNLLAFNMQYLAFFPQTQWKQAFQDAVCAQNSIITSTISHMHHPPGIKQEYDDGALFFEEFLLEPANEQDAIVNLTFSHEQQPLPLTTPGSQTRQRRRSSIRLYSRGYPPSSVMASPGISILELMAPNLAPALRREISNLTNFQKALAIYKCREVLGFYKLMLQNRKASKLTSAQIMENSSRYVVRTILNWAREYYNNQGYFNKSKIGKHKRVSLFADVDFQNALLNFAEEQGAAISVDSASNFIKEYHRRRVAEGNENLPGPPSSRATVHRWLKLLDIKLGPRGKKKSQKS